jgi:prepilin-type N-terminal cleavage/methylation domain-containing protein
MKNLHKTSGFTLIEVLLAITILGLVLAPIYMLQGNVLQTASQRAQSLLRLLFAKNLLITGGPQMTADPKKDRIEKKLEDPKTEFLFERKAASKGSSLKQFEHLMLDTVTYSWGDRKSKQKEKIITFVFKPKENA